jgi:glutamate 5-kinase
MPFCEEAGDMRGPVAAAHRIVIKIGTNLLTRDNGLDLDAMEQFCSQMVALVRQGRQVLLVSSGAIGMGATELGIKTRVSEVRMRQACAAIGQPLLMHQYRECFSRHGITIAQVLITREVLNNRKTYLNLQAAVEKLLSLNVIPIFNENDSIAVDEIGLAFGDNDRLSAMVASKTDADLLIILSDIDGLYDGDPKSVPDAKRVAIVPKITDEVMSWAGTPGSTFSTGGMKTKLLAAEIAASAGCSIVLAGGREKDVLVSICSGEDLGTLFLAGPRISARNRWIINSAPKGTIWVDDGAVAALRRHKSLLPSGIIGVEGLFAPGDVVAINDLAKAVTAFDSEELRKLMGHHTADIAAIIGEKRREEVARPEDIVFMD